METVHGMLNRIRDFGLLALLISAPVGLWAQTMEKTQTLLLDPDHRSWTAQAPTNFRVRFETTQGTFVIEVPRSWAPVGADRFYNLVRNGFYDGVRFSRVVPGFIAQFGINGNPAVTKAWKGRTLPDDPVVASNVRGAIAYAMTGPDTRSTQVYINLVDNSRLDEGGFAPFGRIVQGMDVVDRLYGAYGETSGGGMRAGKQGRVEEGGNAFLKEHFPKLDFIKAASIFPVP